MRLHQVVAHVWIAVWTFSEIRPAQADTASNAIGQKSAVDSVDSIVATHEVGDAELKHGIYIYHLKCSRTCELNRITLNTCAAAKSGATSFTPTTDHWIGPNWISAKQMATTIQVKIYQAFGRQLPAEMAWTFNSESGRLTTLRGLTTTGFIDNTQFPEKLVPMAFEAIPLDRSKIFDCPVALKGLTQ